MKLNLGAGSVRIDGWLSVDLNSGSDIVCDLTNGIPVADNSIDFIYSEHFIEHINHEQGRRFLAECVRVLKQNGVARFATPDLGYIVAKYLSPDWRDQDWLTWPEYAYINTPCETLNVSMREWGHQFIYDSDQLKNDLIQSGFKKVYQVHEWGVSQYAELNGLETRKDSMLIMEAVKL